MLYLAVILVDVNNKEIFPIKYEDFRELKIQKNNGSLQNTDMYIVRLEEKYGIVDKKNNEILPIKYEDLDSKINERNLIAARINKRWGFLELPSGKVIIPFNYIASSIYNDDSYYRIPEFSIGGSKSIVKVKDLETKEIVYFDTNGNRVNERGEPLRVQIAKNVFLHTKKGETLVGLEDKDGKIILKPTYSTIKKAGRFTNNMAIVSLNGKSGLINTQGKEIIPCTYDDIFIGNINDNRNRDYNDDDDIERDAMKKSFYIVLFNGKYGIVNKVGKLVISPKFDALAPFEEESGLTMTNIGGKVLKSSSYAIPSIEGGKFGLIDKDGNEIAPCKYDFVNKLEKNEHTLVNIGGKMDYRKNKVVGGKWGIINNKGVEVVPVIYEEIVQPFKPTIFDTSNETAAKLNGKWGLIDKQNKVVVPFEYQFIDTHLQSEMVAVSNNRIEWGFVDKTGKLVIPMKFKAISTHPPSFTYSTATVSVDNEPVYIDKSGNVLGVNEFEQNYNRNKSNSAKEKEDTTPNNSSTQKNNKVESNSNTTSSEKKLKRIKWKCDGCGEIVIMEGSARPQANKSRCSNPKVKNSTYHSWDSQGEIK